MPDVFPLRRKKANPSAPAAFGYKTCEDDPIFSEPIPEELEKLSEALDAIDNGSSYRETAAWLVSVTGRKISHTGLSNIWRDHRGSDPKNARATRQKAQRRKIAPKTGPDKAKAKIRRKAADAKRILTISEKKLAEWVDVDAAEVLAPVAPAILKTQYSDTLDFEAVPDEQDVIFKPNPGPQTDFLSATEMEVLYGGAAGGGKTYALIADPARDFGHPQFNGLILRRTNDELREIIWKTQEIYPRAFPGAKWAEKKSQWTFPGGGRLWLTYLERDEDVLRYQGQAFSYVAFDELTQYPTPFAWNYMRTRLRTTAQGLSVSMRATTNPGGPGHGWVKAMFIDPAPANTCFAATDLDTGKTLCHPDVYASSHPLAGQPNPKAGQPLFMRRFIPASLYDNPYLLEDGNYESNLLSMPEMQRRQLLEGDWGIAEGAAFSEFRTSTHVVEPFDIPPEWRRFRSCDYGYSSFSAVHWFAIDPSYETLICYRELYVSKHTGRDLGVAVRNAEQGDNISYGVLDSSAWHNRGQIGPSIAEEMINAGTRWRPSDRTAGARVAGKNRLHEVLKVDPDTGTPGIVFFNTCRQIIADLPVIPSDPKGTDDIDPRYRSDHAYDSVRYAVMSRPRAFSPFSNGPGQDIGTEYRPADRTFGY